VESFDHIAVQYKPMIHKIIQTLHIYKNQEEFYQTGLIGLWEAHQSFNPMKGEFINYAYTYIKGQLQTEMLRSNRLEERYVYPEEEYWEIISGSEPARGLETEILLSYCQGLTEKETKWVMGTFIDGLSIRQLAEKENITVSAVKQWKSGALRKLNGVH
jgi:RNA polymerase sigma factor (sigma-70 family)